MFQSCSSSGTQTACSAPLPIIVLMCRAVGVRVMLPQEMKCIVGHKKELSNVGAPQLPVAQGQWVYVTAGHRVTAQHLLTWQAGTSGRKSNTSVTLYFLTSLKVVQFSLYDNNYY